MGFCLTDDDKSASLSSCMYISSRNYINQIYFPAIKTDRKALLNSGANHNNMSPSLADKFVMQRFQLPTAIQLTTADSSCNNNIVIM